MEKKKDIFHKLTEALLRKKTLPTEPIPVPVLEETDSVSAIHIEPPLPSAVLDTPRQPEETAAVMSPPAEPEEAAEPEAVEIQEAVEPEETEEQDTTEEISGLKDSDGTGDLMETETLSSPAEETSEPSAPPANHCTTYFDYCLALQRGERTARLVHYVRTWFISLARRADAARGLFPLDQYEAPRPESLDQDALSYILYRSSSAFSHILNNMRDKIVRENVMVPVQKAREIDSAGISWLCRRPGATVREKLAGTRSVLAVKRRMSLDTGENRLLLSMSRMAESIINAKIDCVGSEIGTAEEEDFLRIAQMMRTVDGVEEIRAWENMPPNNVLLSDRYYHQIWNAWNELNELDELVEEDFTMLSEHLAAVIFGILIDILKKRFRFTQQMVAVDYRTCSLGGKSNTLRGISLDSRELILSHDGAFLAITFGSDTVSVEVQDTVLRLRHGVDGPDQMEETDLDAAGIVQAVEKIVVALGIPEDLPRLSEPAAAPRCATAVMDLFHLRPLVSYDSKPPVPAPFRFFGQRQNDVSVPCHASMALRLTDEMPLFSIVSTMQMEYRSQSLYLARMLREQVDCRSFSFLFPDCYSEFDLSALRSSLRIEFHMIDTLPQSIAALFFCGGKAAWKKKFKTGDFALVADISGTCCMLTLLKGKWADPETYGGYEGLVWERYPSFSIDFSIEKQYSQAVMLEKFSTLKRWNGLPVAERQLLQVFGIDGLMDAAKDTAFLLEDNSWTSLGTEDTAELSRLFKLDISDMIEDFLIKMKGLIQRRKIHTVLLSPFLVCGTDYSPETCIRQNVMEGFLSYQNALKACGNRSLWRDHLPSLSIKRFIGRFDLVRNENTLVNPVYHKRIPIKIDSTFTLPKGQKSYRFQLIQGGGTGTRYAAVVEHKAFPLGKAVECRLRMSYCYGADDPYSLIFEPLNPAHVGFREAKVKWTPLEHFDSQNMPVPPFPEELSWQQIKHYPNRHHPKIGGTDLLNWLTVGFNKMCTEMKRPRAAYTLVRPLKPDEWKPAGTQGFRTAVVDVQSREGIVRLKLRDDFFDHPDETHQELRSISCSLHSVSDPHKYETIRLSDHQVTWRENAYGHFCTIKRIQGSEKQNIIFYESRFEPGTFSEQVDLISFYLTPAKAAKDLTESISLGNHDFEWRTDRNGFDYCIEYVTLSDGTEERIFFHEKSFLFAEDFPPPDDGILTFRLQTKPNGTVSARDIVVGSMKNYQAVSISPGQICGTYNTRNLRAGNKPSFDPVLHCKKTLFFPLHKVFRGGRSLGDIDCTDELRSAVRSAVPELIKAYKERESAYDPGEVGFVSITILSRLAENIGKEFYALAEEAVDHFIAGENVVTTIGYALGSLETPMQQALWAKILTIPSVSDIIEICAHAAWNNARFVFVVDRTRILSLFEATVSLLSSYLTEPVDYDLRKARQTLARYIEFLLAVFRLRRLNELAVDDYLSLNNPTVEKLYYCAEKLYELRIPIQTFLTFRVSEDIPYEKMPDILYTLVVCITGESGGGEIIISGMNEDSDNDEQFDEDQILLAETGNEG